MGEMFDYIPSIDYSKFDISRITSYMTAYKSKRKIFIGNNDCKSSQSDNNINFDYIIKRLTETYTDILFFVSNQTGIKKNNLFYIKDLLSRDIENDLNECSYVSTFCDVIIGRYSGPSTFSYVKDNLYKNKKFIMLVNENMNWDMDFSLKNTGTQFIPCNFRDEKEVSDFIIKIIEN
jgi:hypothetical protein